MANVYVCCYCALDLADKWVYNITLQLLLQSYWTKHFAPAATTINFHKDPLKSSWRAVVVAKKWELHSSDALILKPDAPLLLSKPPPLSCFSRVSVYRTLSRLSSFESVKFNVNDKDNELLVKANLVHCVYVIVILSLCLALLASTHQLEVSPPQQQQDPPRVQVPFPLLLSFLVAACKPNI